jgi:hypothetical protein
MQFVDHRQIIERDGRRGRRLPASIGGGEKVVEQRSEIPLGSGSDGDLPKTRKLAATIAAGR